MIAPDNKTTHTLHRLEDFSDIIIGFCLAQLGLNLFLPRSGSDLGSVWLGMNVLIAAFVAIALLWWLYHRIVSMYLVLSPLMIVLNFCMLCGVILSTYLLESVVHVMQMRSDPTRFVVLLVISFAVVYSLLGIMLYTGMRLRRDALPQRELRWAEGELSGIAMTIPAATATIALLTHNRWGVFVAVIMALAVYAMRRVQLLRSNASPSTPMHSKSDAS